MSDAAPSLPDDPAEPRAMIAALEAENPRMQVDIGRMLATVKAHEALVQALQIRIARLQRQRFGARGSAPEVRRQRFGASSEKIEREIEQLELALEALEVATSSATGPVPDEYEDEAEAEQPTPESPPRRRKPKVTATTPRERIVLDPGEACPDCGGALRLVGENVSEILELITATLKVIETARPKKSCRRCESEGQPATGSRAAPNHPGAGALTADPAQHGRSGPARAHPGLQVRQPPSLVSAERDLRPHGR